jgi:3-oxoacyl-[acyl-carrier-protein] synthase-3
MTWDDAYLESFGVALGRLVEPAEEHADLHQAGVRSVAVEPELTAAELAAEAALDAMSRVSSDARCRLVVHCSLWYQGAQMWPAASFVARAAAGPEVLAVDLQQQCNGGLIALELAAGLLSTWSPDDRILVTTGDRFDAPTFDRWHGDNLTVYGDAGTAVVVARRPAALRLVSTFTRTDNSLEGAVRGGVFHPPESVARCLDLTGMGERYLRSGARLRDVGLKTAQVVIDSVEGCLAGAGLTVKEVDHVVMGFQSRSQFEWQSTHVIGVPLEKTNWDFVSRVGHLGAGDQFAALHDAVRSGRVGRDGRVLLVGGGAGFNCTSAVVHVVDNMSRKCERESEARCRGSMT